MKNLDETTRTPFWIASMCGVIFLAFAASVLINGFSAAQLVVLLVPVALYVLAIRDFGEGSVIEAGVPAIIIAILLAMSIPIYARWNSPRKRLHPSARPFIKNASKSSVKPAAR